MTSVSAIRWDCREWLISACGFYKKKIPLRAIGVFPTWDRLIFAVRKDSGIQSLEDIKKQKYPLRISTRRKGQVANNALRHRRGSQSLWH